MLKQHLQLEKEAQLQDYDGLIGHTTVVTIRYMFLSFRQRLHTNQRTLGSLFHACCEEAKDLSMIEALQRLLTFIIAKIRGKREFAEDVLSKMIDAMMGAAVESLETMRIMHNKITD